MDAHHEDETLRELRRRRKRRRRRGARRPRRSRDGDSAPRARRAFMRPNTRVGVRGVRPAPRRNRHATKTKTKTKTPPTLRRLRTRGLAWSPRTSRAPHARDPFAGAPTGVPTISASAARLDGDRRLRRRPTPKTAPSGARASVRVVLAPDDAPRERLARSPPLPTPAPSRLARGLGRASSFAGGRTSPAAVPRARVPRAPPPAANRRARSTRAASSGDDARRDGR